jgi:multicomponent Na+:H+ antiporter subunit E
MRIKLLSLLSLTLFWLGLMGVPNSYLTISYLIGSVAASMIFAIRFSLLPQQISFNRKIFLYLLCLIKEIYLSALMVIKLALSKDMRLNPQLSAIKSIQNTDAGLVLYANSITLTPGTVTLNIAGDALLVHALDSSAMESLKEGVMDAKIYSIT